MEETSTQVHPKHISRTRADQTSKPSNASLQFIRQFARAYMPLAQMPGIVLN